MRFYDTFIDESHVPV